MCCALHNWLLEIDGLSDNWENGVPSVWEGPMGWHSISTVCQHAAPSVLNVLQNDNKLQSSDASTVLGMPYHLIPLDHYDTTEVPDDNEN